MGTKTTFYLSKVIGSLIYDFDNNIIGKLIDISIDFTTQRIDDEPVRPIVTGIKIKASNNKKLYLTISELDILKVKAAYKVTCKVTGDIPEADIQDHFFLVENILDKQIVDLNGRKLVRVNDIRLVTISGTAYLIAVDVGMEGLLRRIGIAVPINAFLHLFNRAIPSKFILWDDVEAVDFSNYNIKLSTVSSKLHTLHPSDLADIIEDLDKRSGAAVFSSLDDEKAADVLEELETSKQLDIIEHLSVEKAADVLEKMPANEAADIIEELEIDKAEQLLKEMESEASEDVRELLEYSNNAVGSLMTTEFISFQKTSTISDVLQTIRNEKPEAEALYNLFITGHDEKLIATVPFRDLLISEPNVILSNIMNKNPIFLFDTDKVDSLAETVSKYNLLAIPVTDETKKLLGMVIIDDIIEDLVSKRKTNKR